ncbi:MAG: hypothetical protein H6922_02410 [Pseudomonadaceae bacterium]|nr:hypothetical protein [Pseudomonadaceae bacterium]
MKPLTFLGEDLGDLREAPLFYWHGDILSDGYRRLRRFVASNRDEIYQKKLLVMGVTSDGGKSLVMDKTVCLVRDLQSKGIVVVTVGFCRAYSAASCLVSAGSLALVHPELEYGVHCSYDREGEVVSPSCRIATNDYYHDLAEHMGLGIDSPYDDELMDMLASHDITVIDGVDVPHFGLAHDVLDGDHPVFERLIQWRHTSTR